MPQLTLFSDDPPRPRPTPAAETWTFDSFPEARLFAINLHNSGGWTDITIPHNPGAPDYLVTAVKV